MKAASVGEVFGLVLDVGLKCCCLKWQEVSWRGLPCATLSSLKRSHGKLFTSRVSFALQGLSHSALPQEI
jgi:hypothetical protein